MPTLAEFLEIAKQRQKNVIFDIREPPTDHPYYLTYANKTLETVVVSGIDLRKVCIVEGLFQDESHASVISTV